MQPFFAKAISMRSAALMFACALELTGCASMLGAPGRVQHAGSVVDYLYPDARTAPQLQTEVTHLRPPVRAALAFVPGSTFGGGPTEAEKLQLLQRVKDAFADYGYIGSIEVIPSNYLRARGGFDNVDQIARMFDVEVIALVGYDQVQFNDNNALAVLYWTIVGAYVVRGDRYDVQTLVDTSVFEIRSRKLLFRAPGSSEVKGAASLAGFSERSRAAQARGFRDATAQMIPTLRTQLEEFKQRIRNDAAFKIEDKPGYHSAGDLQWVGLALAFGLFALAHARQRGA